MGRTSIKERTKKAYREGQTIKEFAEQENIAYSTAAGRLAAARIKAKHDYHVKPEVQERNRQMIEEYESNEDITVAEIAEKYGISRQRVYLVFQDEGVKYHNKR